MLKRFVLTLACPDIAGIVAAVANFLLEHKGFILESAQFGDASTGTFFMRTLFEVTETHQTEVTIRQEFAAIAARFSMKWTLSSTDMRMKMVIMVSKESHCLNDLLHRQRTGRLNIDIPAVISNHQDLAEMTQWYGVAFHHLPVSKETKHEQESKVLELIGHYKADVVVLARYMQILSPELSSKLNGRAINIHHSFLPSFKGAKPYHQAYDKGVKLIGATAHYVTDDLDEGPIIDQEVIRVDHTHDPQKMVALGCDIECRTLARAVKYHSENRVLLNGSKTVVFY
ncbi:MAG: formyltetrahydrofolate deformylase [Alphaproteobacteria bacterium]|nr:formyltetrahydrofolate deformylase [Alphaproteobacteria bacterium]